MTGLGERVSPRRLGTDFRWLWGAALAGNLGDGVLLAAAPLLIASLTTDPLAVALAVFLQRLPWLFFAVVAGAIVDRADRRLIAVVVSALRAAVVAVVVGAILADSLSVGLVYAMAFLLGSAETFADNAASALVADLVPRDALGPANARLIGSMMVTNQLAGPPIGAALFGAGRATPFGAYVVCTAAAGVLFARTSPRAPVDESSRSRLSLRHEIAEGIRWLWHHPPVRILAITIALFNVTWGASIAVQVLYAQERLGVGDLGFGLFLAASAVGGVVGAASYGALERHVSLGTLMRIGLCVETFSHLLLALTTSPWFAAFVMFCFGAHAAVWSTTSTTVRQRAVPSRLLGRVGSVYMLAVLGPLALGTLIGGVLAQWWGVTAPLWFAFAGCLVSLIVLWPQFPLIAHAAEDGPAEADESRSGSKWKSAVDADTRIRHTRSMPPSRCQAPWRRWRRCRGRRERRTRDSTRRMERC